MTVSYQNSVDLCEVLLNRYKLQMHRIPSSYLFVQTICDSGSSRLVDDTKDIEARNRPRIFGGLTLRVIKVCRNCYNSICDSL